MKKVSLLVIVLLVIPSFQAQEWQSYESEHFIFYYQKDHLTEAEIISIVENQEALFIEITDLLDLEFSKKITYYLYRYRKDYEGIPGAYCVGTEIQFLCEFCVDFCKNGLNDAHEMTHALASEIGFQHGLLAEGLAVYVEDYYIRGENLHSIVKILLEEDRVTPLEDLVDDFWCDILYNYDIAGSFVVFLIEEYGMDKFKELYSKPLSEDSFGEVYWRSLSVLEKKWLSTVQEAEVTQKEKDIVQYRDTIKEGLAIYFEYGFGSIDYGTYPAKAEEGICLFRKMYDEDPKAAFSHLDQFNQGMVAWKKAMETFEEALTQKDFGMKAALFKKALSLYETAGDYEMIDVSQKYAAAYESLAFVVNSVEQGDVTRAEEELDKVKPLFEELEHEEEIRSLEQYITDLKEQTVEEVKGVIVLVLICVLILKVSTRFRKKYSKEADQ